MFCQVVTQLIALVAIGQELKQLDFESDEFNTQTIGDVEARCTTDKDRVYVCFKGDASTSDNCRSHCWTEFDCIKACKPDLYQDCIPQQPSDTLVDRESIQQYIES